MKGTSQSSNKTPREYILGFLETIQEAQVFDWFMIVTHYKCRVDVLCKEQIFTEFEQMVKEEIITPVDEHLYVKNIQTRFGSCVPDIPKVMKSFGRILRMTLLWPEVYVENWLGVHCQVPVRYYWYTTGPTEVLTIGWIVVELTHKTKAEMKALVEQYEEWENSETEFGSKLNPGVKIKDICFLTGGLDETEEAEAPPKTRKTRKPATSRSTRRQENKRTQ